MIRSLRTRHRLLIAGVGLVAGTLGAAGLAVRRPIPAIELPAPLVEDSVPIAHGAAPPEEAAPDLTLDSIESPPEPESDPDPVVSP